MRAFYPKLKLIPTDQPFYQTDDEGGGEGTESGGGESGGDSTKTFTQADVDRIVTNRVKKMKADNDKLLTRLKALETTRLTPEDRDALESQIQELEQANMTKEEIMQSEIKKLTDKHMKEIEKTSSAAKTWQERFQRSTINQALTAAAVETNAANTDQILMMFGGASELVEKMDGGKPTGEFDVVMSFKGLDPETKSVTSLKLPVAEAMKKLREDGLNDNLFKHGQKSGTGSPTGRGEGRDPTQMPLLKNYATHDEYVKAYQEWRQAKSS